MWIVCTLRERRFHTSKLRKFSLHKLVLNKNILTREKDTKLGVKLNSFNHLIRKRTGKNSKHLKIYEIFSYFQTKYTNVLELLVP